MTEKKNKVVTINMTEQQLFMLNSYMEKRLITTKSRAFVDALVFAHDFLFNRNYRYIENSVDGNQQNGGN